MSSPQNVEEWRVAKDNWMLSVANVLDYGWRYPDEYYDVFILKTLQLHKMVVTTRPDLDAKCLALIADEPRTKRHATHELYDAFSRSMVVLEAAIETMRNASVIPPVQREDSREATLLPSPGRLDVLRVLAKSKTRMSQPLLIAAMKKAGLYPSPATIRIEMPRMMKVGWIDNDQKAKPVGYAITELGRKIIASAE
jgi:hypothetical protein